MTHSLNGIFDLRSPEDLRRKLLADYELLKATPDDVYLAFNFFVTAEHIPDWIFPGSPPPRQRTTLKCDPLLQACSHIANGAKHFCVNRHKSVTDTRRVGGFFGNYFGRGYWGRSYWGGPHLVIDLDGDAAAAYGQSISCMDLATRVVDFWRAHPLK